MLHICTSIHEEVKILSLLYYSHYSSLHVTKVSFHVSIWVLVLDRGITYASSQLFMLYLHGSKLELFSTLHFSLQALVELQVRYDMLLSLQLHTVLHHESLGGGELVL